MQNKKNIWLVFLIALALGVGYLFLRSITLPSDTDIKNTSNTCTQESLLCPDGSYVGRNGPNCEFDPCPELKTVDPEIEAPPDCLRGGCSGQICSDDEDIATTCEYVEAYACYKTAKCERQVNGECGWTMTSALIECLETSAN